MPRRKMKPSLMAASAGAEKLPGKTNTATVAEEKPLANVDTATDAEEKPLANAEDYRKDDDDLGPGETKWKTKKLCDYPAAACESGNP